MFLTIISDHCVDGVLPKIPKATSSMNRRKHRPASSSLFTGREDVLNRLENYFEPRGTGRHRRREFLLHGLGGAGKTQLMLKFAEIRHSRYS